MFLAYFDRASGRDEPAFLRAVDDFSLSGARAVTTATYGRLTVVTTSDRPLPPSVSTPDGRAVVAASGEAYDLPAGRGLAEALLERFTAQGAALTPPRNGTFAFLAHDSTRDEVIAGNDAFGFHPLFVLDTPGFVAFCSEPEPLRALIPGGPELDPSGVAQFFVFGSTLGGTTLVRGVRNLDAGTIVTFTLEGSASRVHDDLAVPVDRSLDFEQHVARVAEAFRAAVQRRVQRYPDATLSLTGGADTRLMLSCTTPEQRRRLGFVTHYIIDGKADDDRDVVIARQLAQAAGLRHEVQHRAGASRPFSPEGYQRLRERPVVPSQLHGVWGGEYMGGAAVDVALFPVERVTRQAVNRRAERLLSPEVRAGMADLYEALQAEYARCKAGNREFQFWIGMFARPFLTHLYFGSAGLSAGAWMWPWAQNLRLTSPYQDAEFLRTLLAVPFEHVSGYKLYNELYARHFREFTGIPTNSGLAVRSDSALAMFVEGTEPKRRIRRLSFESRQAGFRALDQAGDVWELGVFAREPVRAQCLRETTERPPSFTERMKSSYTTSWLYRSRRHLPLHGMLMKWKAKHETARAATLDAALVGAVIDFEHWTRYSGVGRREHAPT